MEEQHNQILLRLRKNIIADLDVDNVLRHLRSEYILTELNVEDIRKENALKEQQAERLLDILPSRGPNAFHVFNQSLKNHYPWISSEIEKLLKPKNDNASNTYQRINIPPISPLTVTREEKVKQLREGLKKLKPQEWLVIHGMEGFGRASLVANTLQDQSLIEQKFQNQIYWIKFCNKLSNLAEGEEILTQLNMLCGQIDENISSQPKNNAESWETTLKQCINVHFKKNRNCEALLVLEDVCSKYIVDAFTFPCKTLVITNDVEVTREKYPTIIEMKDGFTEEETLRLFARVLNTKTDNLPAEAKLIHKECNGMPLLIAMLSANFEAYIHNMNHSSDRWRYYLKCLKTKNEENKVLKEFLRKQQCTFKMCIDQLNDDMKQRYELLVIFKEHVNIMPETVRILWGEKEVHHVEDLLLDFCHKSLAAKQWNDDLKKYIYGVHGLLLSYLRDTTDPEDLRRRHETFVKNCRDHVKGDFSVLPNDNYIYPYIGHHLEEAGLFHEFPVLYFDLKFLQAKIEHAGLSDLFIDLKKYRRHITNDNDPELVSQIEDLEHFLMHNTTILVKQKNNKSLDLVQLGLNFSEDGFVSRAARKLASERSIQGNSCYLSLERKKRPLIYDQLPIIDFKMKGSITVTRFTDDPNEILVGNSIGEIFLADCKERSKKVFFQGYAKGDGIKNIVLSSDFKHFLALSNNGIVKCYTIVDDPTGNEPKSPRQLQNNWSNICNQSSNEVRSLTDIQLKNEKITDVAFGENDENIAICTAEGTVQIRDLRGNILLNDLRKDSYLRNIVFAFSYKLLFVLDNSKGVFIVYSLPNYQYVAQFNTREGSMNVLYLEEVIILGSNHLVFITEKTVFIMTYKFGAPNLKVSESYVPHNWGMKSTIKLREDDSTVFTNATLTHDHNYLILADSAGTIKVWSTSDFFKPLKTLKINASSLDTALNELYLICGSEGQIVHRWDLDIDKKEPVKSQLAVSVVMKPYDEHDIIGKETEFNTIEIMSDDNVLYRTETVPGKVKKMFLKKDGNEVVCILNNMEIYHIECSSKTSTRVDKLAEIHNFITTMTLCDTSTVIFNENVENSHNLKIWFHDDDKVLFLKDIGQVINVHKVNDSIFAIVNRDCLIRCYEIRSCQKGKREIVQLFNCKSKTPLTTNEMKVVNSCLSPNSKFLLIIHDNKEMSILEVQYATEIQLVQIWTQIFEVPPAVKFTCAEFSDDEHYLAVGSNNGEVWYLSTLDSSQNTLMAHKTSVNQLHWAATNVGVPLLLTVCHEEMAVWNISLINSMNSMDSESFKRSNSSRYSSKGPRRRIGEARTTSSSRTSLSVNNVNVLANAIEHLSLTDSNVTAYWKSKIGTDSEKPELIVLLTIPWSGTTKVFVSKDFTKYIMTDENGSINKYKLTDFS